MNSKTSSMGFLLRYSTHSPGNSNRIKESGYIGLSSREIGCRLFPSCDWRQ